MGMYEEVAAGNHTTCDFYIKKEVKLIELFSIRDHEKY